MKRLLIIVAVLVLILVDLNMLSGPVSATGSVTVTAWTCTDPVDAQSIDPQAFATACPEEAVDTMFALTAAGVTRRRATTANKSASWPAVLGEFTLKIDNGQGGQSVVFCQRDDGPYERFEVADAQIRGDLSADFNLTCHWYLLAAASPPSGPTPSPTIVPTSTPMLPVATALPTATAFPTATSAAIENPATTTPGDMPPMPEVVYPPAMYRGDVGRTGEQPGPGPAGDPVLLWRYPVAQRPISSPVISGGTLYIGGDDGLLAIHSLTGTQRWLAPTELPVVSTPAVVDGLVYFGSQDGRFACVDQQTGAERWSVQTGGMILTSPLVVEGSVYFLSYDRNLYALDAETGQEQWRLFIDGTEFFASPAFHDDILIVGTGDIDGGYLYGVDAESGAELWRHQVAGAIGTTPAVVDGVVYFGSDDGFAYAFDTETLERNWREPTGKLIRSSAAVAEGRVFIGNRLGHLYVFNAESGELRWEFDTGDWVDSPPAFVGDTIYVGTKHRKFYVLTWQDGAIVWEYHMGASITTSPIVQGSVIYYAARDGFLYAIGGTESVGESTRDGEPTSRPSDVPEEIALGGDRFLFDRMLPLDLEGLTEIDRIGRLTFYSRENASDGAIYVQIVDWEEEESDDELARYVPERVGVEDVECGVEGPRNAAVITSGEFVFVYAGVEPDLDVDDLVGVTESPVLGTVYAESAEPPIFELFTEEGGTIGRYVLLDEDGLPEHLQGPVPFNGAIYQFAADVTDEMSAQQLIRVGCAGPFPIEVAGSDRSGSYRQVIAVVNDRLLAFDVIPAADETTDE